MDNIDILCLGKNSHNNIAHLKLETIWNVNYLPTDELDALSEKTQQEILIIISDKGKSALLLSDIFLNHPQLQTYQVKLCVFTEKPQSIPELLIANFDDFIFLPCDANNFQVRLSLLGEHLTNFNKSDSKLNSKLLEEFTHFNLKGISSVFTRTLSLIKKIARCDASVLIEGETGTGKENAARAMHYLNNRKDKAFIPINCGAIPDNLIESELFGFERGAFTDAKQKQLGMIAIANNGTLFLDEVDSLSPRAQATLLRFLQTGEYRPLGSTRTKQSNVRIIAATNARLDRLVEQGDFREDLYFRLNVLQVRMPPLRERPEDIEVIARHLLSKYLHQYQRGPTRIHPGSINWLKQQSWKGNVRELENILLREFLLSAGDYLFISDQTSNPVQNSATEPQSCPNFKRAKAASIKQFEENYLKEILTIADGNVSRAARLAGKERRSLGKLIKKYQIDIDVFKPKLIDALRL